MRTQALALVLSYLLLSSRSAPLSAQDKQNSSTPADSADARESAAVKLAPSAVAGKGKALMPGQFILQDATPVKLRLSRAVSSAFAHKGDSVEFAVTQDVAACGIVVIPKGAVAIGKVTEAQPKRRLGRAGKIEIVLDYVRLADKETAAVRAVKDVKGKSRTAGMTVGIVASGLLFFPAAPLFLFIRGKDITLPNGAEVTAFIDGDALLDASKFSDKPAGEITVSVAKPVAASTGASCVAVANGTAQLTSAPAGAEIYVDDELAGTTPAKLNLAAGKRTIRMELKNYKTWSVVVTVEAGVAINLSATMEE